MVPLDNRIRTDMPNMEREIVEMNLGLLNNEPWAGKQ